VQTRVEARWDQNLSGADALGGPASFLSTDERCAVGLYANVIYKF